MNITFYLTIATAVLSVISGFISLPEKASRRIRLSLQGLLLLSAFVTVASARVSAVESERQKAEGEHRRIASERHVKEARDALVRTERTCDDSKKVIAKCAAAYREGRPYAEFYADLTPEQKQGYPVPYCGLLPPWRIGGADVRVSAWPTREQAEESLRTIRTALARDGQAEWVPHVMETAVESHAFEDPKRKLWVGAFRQVEAAYAERICGWLVCKGIKAGVERCGPRNPHGVP